MCIHHNYNNDRWNAKCYHNSNWVLLWFFLHLPPSHITHLSSLSLITINSIFLTACKVPSERLGLMKGPNKTQLLTTGVPSVLIRQQTRGQISSLYFGSFFTIRCLDPACLSEETFFIANTFVKIKAFQVKYPDREKQAQLLSRTSKKCDGKFFLLSIFLLLSISLFFLHPSLYTFVSLSLSLSLSLSHTHLFLPTISRVGNIWLNILIDIMSNINYLN